jgi:hypothetical protein
MRVGSTESLTEMSTMNISEGKVWPTCKADNLTTICEPTVLESVEASTSHNPMGLHGLLQRQLYLYIYIFATQGTKLIIYRDSFTFIYIYRVNQTSVKHFENLQ